MAELVRNSPACFPTKRITGTLLSSWKAIAYEVFYFIITAHICKGFCDLLMNALHSRVMCCYPLSSLGTGKSSSCSDRADVCQALELSNCHQHVIMRKDKQWRSICHENNQYHPTLYQRIGNNFSTYSSPLLKELPAPESVLRFLSEITAASAVIYLASDPQRIITKATHLPNCSFEADIIGKTLDAVVLDLEQEYSGRILVQELHTWPPRLLVLLFPMEVYAEGPFARVAEIGNVALSFFENCIEKETVK